MGEGKQDGLIGRFGFGFRGINWKSIKDILDNRLVANLYLWIFITPIFIKALQHIPVILVVMPAWTETDLIFDLTLPFSLYLLCFSAVFFAIAWVLYISYCPHFLRRYSSAAAAISDGATAQFVKTEVIEYLSGSGFTMPDFKSAAGESLKALFDQYRADWMPIRNDWQAKSDQCGSIEFLCSVLSKVKFVESSAKPGYYELEPNMDEKWQHTAILVEREQFLKTISWDLIKLQNASKPLVRALILFLICSGMILFLIPVVQNFYFVLRYLFTT